MTGVRTLQGMVAGRFPLFVRLVALINLAISIFAVAWPTDVCYTCDGATLMGLIAIHLLVLATTWSQSLVTNLIGLVLVVFYASRPWMLQVNLVTFTYEASVPTISEMRDIVLILALVAASLLAGAFVGSQLPVPGGDKRRLEVLPFSDSLDQTRFYYILVAWFLVGELFRLYLFATSGIGLPISKELLDLRMLRLSKSVEVLTPLAAVPIAWLILRRPKGRERVITVLAATAFVLVQLSTLSKVALIYAVTPFVLTFTVTGRRIPPGLLIRAGATVAAVALFVSSAVSTIRRTIEFMYESGTRFEVASFSLNAADNLAGFFGRVGSSFDVLAFVTQNRHSFDPYLNFIDELKDIPNTYLPGDIIAVDPPRWSQLLYSLGHDADFAAVYRTANGENITLPAHLYVNFGLTITLVGCFVVLAALTYFYRRSDSVVVRMALLTAVVNEVPNGSGIVNTVQGLFNLLAIFFVSRFVYFALFAAMKRSSEVRREHRVMPGAMAAAGAARVRPAEFEIGELP